MGVGAQLHALAWAQGSELATSAWLTSKFCNVAMASSLPVERSHNEIKKWETSNLTHIAAASRNAMRRRFLMRGAAQGARMQTTSAPPGCAH